MRQTMWVLALAASGGFGAAACGDEAREADATSDTVDSADAEVTPDSPDLDATTEAGDTADTSEPEVAAPVPRLRFMIDERPHDDSDSEVAAVEARWGDPMRVVIDGLAPGAVATLAFTSAAGSSQARFVADGEGVIDLGRDAPTDLAGPELSDWSVAHADAFMWSMRDALDEPFDASVHAWAYVDGVEVASGTLQRHTLNQDIVGESVADGTTRGHFAQPPGEGPFRGVLCFGGSEGGTETGVRCAMYLASLGYAALGVGYFGAEGLPEALTEVPLEILEGDLAWLDARVAPGGVVVVGGSRGGELALLLGARFAVVKGVVGQVPSGYVWPSIMGEAAAWSYGGEPLAYVPSSDTLAQAAVSSEGIRGYATRVLFFDAIEGASADELAAATIPIEALDGPVLLLGGADDQLWPSCELAEVAYQRLVADGHAARHDDRFMCAPEAGHFSIGTPGWSLVGSTAIDFPAFSAKLVMGGTVAGNGAAMRANDTATRALLERVLGPGRIRAPSTP